MERYTNKRVKLSDVPYQDNFENESVGGSIELIEKYFPGYTYSFEMFEADLIKAINNIKLNNN